MPELPEVETVRRGLEPAMAGKIVNAVTLRRAGLRVPFPHDLENILKKRPVLRITRRAKYLLIHIGGGHEDVLIVHLGMSGQMSVITKIKAYEPKKHDHMILTLNDGMGVVFNDARRFGMVMLSPAANLEAHPAFCDIGPEPLGNEFNGPVLRERLKGKITPIKLALLDQHIVAGVGNIYASEALYEAGISPLRKAGEVPAVKTDALASAIQNVLNRAIASGGSSLKDFIRTDGQPGYFQHSFAVYDRAGEACPRCHAGGKKKSVIQKIVQSGRSTYFCPHCQK